MRTTTRAVLAGVCSATALAIPAAAPATAAPYTPDALLQISLFNPILGGTITITVLNFETGELIDITLSGVDLPLGTLTANSDGTATGVIKLPKSALCEQTLTATGRNSGSVATSSLLIGGLNLCGERTATERTLQPTMLATPTTGSGNSSPAVATAAAAGLAVVAGAGFLARRRKSYHY
ncbi:hypothetical protein [Sporichthya polymorpha]|uniref:hypothetical protein n=1 Tax=Sporichthya polymorpha TaxID=35751 RepID=UPI0003611E94|nr:hypothetical protein [Sporichthya polymorpha]